MEHQTLEYPRLNIILDSRRVEKYNPLMEVLKEQNITDYEIWPCLIYPDVVESINASHKMVVKKAKDDGLKECCIAEDDLFIPHKNGWEWFLKNKPERFDIYVGGNYLPFDKMGEGAFKVDCIVGLHLYIIHSRYYDTFLDTPNKRHIDTEQKSKEMYCCYPMAAIQRAGFSANNKSVVNYNGILSDDDIYGGKPK